MTNSFFNLSHEEQLALIRQASRQFQLSDMMIEKDLWVCWLLEKIFALPVQMAFKGGTSLSKVFSLIQRFSEDCDVTIDYRHFMPPLDFQHLSRTQLKKISEQLKNNLKEYAATVVLPYLQQEITAAFPGQRFEMTLDAVGEQLRFYYPSVIHTFPGYLRDHVLIEFGVRNSTEPCEKYQIQPYLAQIVDDSFQLPKPWVNTLSPLRTFWEKATLIHVECHRERFTQTPERLSRHWYDLFMLDSSGIGEQALAQLELLDSVVEHKKAFFNASYANYDECLVGKFRLIPTEIDLGHLEQDYVQMVKAGMFHEEPPLFNHIQTALKNLENKMNHCISNNL